MGERGTEPKGGKGDRAYGEEDRSMREQGISLEMSPFSSEIFGKTIAYKKQPLPTHLSLLPSLHLIFYPLYFYYFNFLFNSGSVFTKQELLINTSSSSL